MITAVFLIYFLESGNFQVISDQRIFKTMEECNQYAEEAKELQQFKVIEGLSDPHTAIHQCIDWGSNV